MPIFISTLPNDLLKRIEEKAALLAIPKNKLIENALQLYLDRLERAEYVKSYQQTEKDEDILFLAEEGLAEHLRILEA